MSTSQPNGYLAVPRKNNGNAVLVLHPWWGLNDTIKTACNRLAEHGYYVFAPDLYHGKIAETIPEAEALSSQLDDSQAQLEVAQSVDFLSQKATLGNRGMAVIGFSLGAYFALELSCSQPVQIRSVVLFYGTGPTDFSQSKAAYLGHFAEQDEYEPLSEVNNLESELRRANRPVKFYEYPGTGHWFCEPDRPDAFNQQAADLAWERTFAFLKDTLQPDSA